MKAKPETKHQTLVRSIGPLNNHNTQLKKGFRHERTTKLKHVVTDTTR